MQAIRPTSQRGPLLSRVYGLRLLYKPVGRRRVAMACAVVAVLDYLREAALDLGAINHRPLKFDFGQFQDAARALADGGNPYDVFISLHCQSWCLGGYIYTPLFAEVLRPLAHVPLPAAAATWLVLSHLMVLATAVVLWRALRGHTTITAMAAMLAAGLLFQPLFENLSYVQIGILLLLIMAGAAALHLQATGRGNFGAGALVGLATVIKVTPLLAAPALVPVGWARRGRAVAAEGAAGIAGLVVATVALVAAMLLFVPHTTDFFTQVLPHIGGGTTVYENKSFPALVGRVFYVAGLLNPGFTWSPDSKLVTLATMAVFLGPTLWLCGRLVPRTGAETPARAAAFAAYVAAMPIVSTITWRHHMVVSILSMALLLPALWPLAGPPASRAARWLLVASYPLSYIQQDLADAIARRNDLDPHSILFAARYLLVQDLNLVGMVCLWLACLLALRGLAERARHVVPVPAPAPAALRPASRGT